MTAKNMAKIGRLMLNGGVWNGQRIVPENYIRESIMPSAANTGYGYLWWLSDNGYHTRGFGGQEINVYPGRMGEQFAKRTTSPDKKVVAVVQATVTPSSKFYSDICENIIF